jgi:hypothetical protein
MKTPRTLDRQTAARNARAGIAGLAGAACNFLRNPSQLRDKMREWKRLRQEAALQARLNRQIRRQFIKAFNRSAKKKMSLEINNMMRRYKSRNGGLFAAFLRPYEAFSSWNMPAKILSMVAFAKGVRHLLWPVMGIWGVVVPLCALIVERMALVYKNAENRRQEEKLAQLGLTVPCNFEVRNGKVLVMDKEISSNLPIGFPVLHTNIPEWVVTEYDGERKGLTAPKTVHAAEFEALRRNCLSQHDVEKIKESFSGHNIQQNCVYAFSIIFPDQTIEEQVAQVRALAEERIKMPLTVNEKKRGLSAKFCHAARRQGETCDAPLPEAMLRALEPFCLYEPGDSGLSILAEKVTLGDIRYLTELQALGAGLERKQALEVVRMLKDVRFSGELSFRQIVEVALWPAELAGTFDDLWKDREYRTRFGFDALKEMALNADGWGGVALRLARHDYSRSLSGEQIIELALPENEHWAKVYHNLRLSMPEIAQTVAHDDLKKAVQEFGWMAGENLNPVKKAPILGIDISR